MKPIIALIALAAATQASAVPGGPIDTMQLGNYVCELPGDATGPAGHRVASEDFEIVNASGYRVQGARGNYLLTGDQLVMTSGPKNGQRFHRVSVSFLRKIGADGKDSSLRCVRRTSNNS